MKEVKNWKLLLYIIGLFLCFVVGAVVILIPAEIFELNEENGLTISLLLIARIIATIFFLKFFIKHIVKIPEINRKLINFNNFQPIRWTVFGIALPTMVILTLILSSNLEVEQVNTNLNISTIINGISISLMLCLSTGILEELVFRGYMQEVLMKRYSFWTVGIGLSILFSVLHLKDVETIVNGLQVLVGGTLISILFLIIYKKTNSIWNAGIVHTLWNFSNGNELVEIGKGFTSAPDKVLLISQKGNDILTGGESGIDVSLFAFIFYVISSILISKGIKNNNNELIKFNRNRN